MVNVEHKSIQDDIDRYNRKCKLIGITPLRLVNENGYITAYCEDEGIKSAVIPNFVQVIGEQAFYRCKDLLEVHLPENLLRINKEAFRFCYNLMTINIPKSLEYIGVGALSNCRSIRDISLPDSLLEIGAASFAGCKGIKELVLPSKINQIPPVALQYCGFKSITIPDKVTFIGELALSYCDDLEEIRLGKGIKRIHERAMVNNDKLKRIYIYEENLGVLKNVDTTNIEIIIRR